MAIYYKRKITDFTRSLIETQNVMKEVGESTDLPDPYSLFKKYDMTHCEEINMKNYEIVFIH